MKCSRCKLEKQIQNFHLNQRYCKECSSKKGKERWKSHRAQGTAYNSAYYATNKEERKKSFLKWANKNRAKIAEKNRAYYAVNKDGDVADNRRRVKEWAANNPEKRRASKVRRRAMKLSACAGWANQFFIEEIYDLAQRRTKLTKIVWEVDHVVPLCNKRVCGLHTEHNLKVVPRLINLAKGNRWWPNMPDQHTNSFAALQAAYTTAGGTLA